MPVPSDDSTTRLQRRARWLLLAVTGPLVGVIVGLALLQLRDLRRQAIDEMVAESAADAVSLDVVAKLATDHVRQMQSWSEGAFSKPADAVSPDRARFVPRVMQGRDDGYTLAAPRDDAERRVGQVFWLGGDPRNPAVGREELSHAFGFFEIARLTHDVTPGFRWSYFFAASRRHVLLYPWVSIDAPMRATGTESQQALMAAWMDFEIAAQARPEHDPTRQLFWTAPYLDGAGAGAMVSLGAPVYVGDRYMGSVGTDLTLEALESVLDSAPHRVGRTWALDGKSQVLAVAAAPRSPEVQSFAKQSGLGADGDRAVARALAQPGVPVQVADRILVVRRLPHAPWVLVRESTQNEVDRLIAPRLVPYGVILLSLALTLVCALFMLRREIVTPALALATYIQRASRGGATPLPRVPGLWSRVVGLVAGTLDLERRATARLRESEAFKAAVVDNAMLGVVITDDRGRIVEFNAAAEAIFLRSRPDAIGCDLVELAIPPDQRASFRERLVARLAGMSSAQVRERREVTVRRGDGSLLAVDVSLSMFRVGDQRYYAAFVADVQAKKLAEQELARQREALRQSERLATMGALLAGLAHELNNPLAILMARSEMLETKTTDATVLADAGRIHAAAQRCGRIVRSFLDMVRQRPAQLRRATIDDVVASAVDLMSNGFHSLGIDVVLDLDPDAPAVEMDVDKIGQVVLNLLVNAQQALQCIVGNRRIVITSGTRARGLVLRVADNGPGVPPEVRDRIFAPFFTTKGEGKGTGVGLSYSLAVAREHGGDLRLMPSEIGAVFELELPDGVTVRASAEPLPDLARVLGSVAAESGLADAE